MPRDQRNRQCKLAWFPLVYVGASALGSKQPFAALTSNVGSAGEAAIGHCADQELDASMRRSSTPSESITLSGFDHDVELRWSGSDVHRGGLLVGCVKFGRIGVSCPVRLGILPSSMQNREEYQKCPHWPKQPDVRVATFNLQNLRLRTRDGELVLDGAADRDQPEELPDSLARADRVETARVIASARADVVALQEVFDLAALDYFHDNFLLHAGSPKFPYRFCIAGNDGRGLNVAALSQHAPVSVVSHADATGADLGLLDLPPDLRDRPIFRRDCLELEFEAVSLFACHFKAPYPDADKAHVVREAEARAVRRIVETRFSDPSTARWIVVGDFNEPANESGHSVPALDALKRDFACDVADRLEPGTDWTYEVPGTNLRSRPDRILLSPLLAKEYPGAVPQIIRSGMAPTTPETGHPHASDHALVYVDLPGL